MIGKLIPRNNARRSYAMADEQTLTQSRYTTPAIVAHWLIAIMIVTNLAIGLTADLLPDEDVRFAIDTHKSIGVTVLGLVLLRILWRAGHKPPPFSRGMASWERGLAHFAHYGLYVLMLWMPITGWLHDSAWKDATTHPMRWFGLFEWPRIGFIMHLPADQKEHLHNLFDTLHTLGGYTLIALLCLHLAGAFKHQFIDGEFELGRMWPG
jgi:cytochrome b561